MTYGEHLDRAAAALAAAQVNLRRPTLGGIADHAAAAIARTHLYRALERQVRCLSADEDDTGLTRELQHATHTTAGEIPLSPPTDHPVPAALRQAADAARVASDILNTQFDPATGHPRSPEGLAIQARLFHTDSLARLAQLARTVSEVDHGLAAWLTRGIAAGSHQLIVRTAASDAMTTSLTLRHTVDAVASHVALHSLLHDLQPPPITDTAQRWAPINSPTDCVRALDVARTWLVQHHRDLTATDFKVLLRTGLALTYEIDYLAHAANRGTRKTPTAGILAAVWRGAARASYQLHTLGNPEPGVGPTVLSAAESWLRSQLRPNEDWRDPTTLFRSRGAKAWRSAGAALAARLPDLTTLIHQGALIAMRRGDMLEPDPLQRRPTDRAVRPKWIRAGPASPQGATLLKFTGQLHEETVVLAGETGSAVLPGVHEADRRPATPRNRALRKPATVPVPTDSTRHLSSPQPYREQGGRAAQGRHRTQAIAEMLARRGPQHDEPERAEQHHHYDRPEDGPSL
ncbi:hypothetical protein [Micromonospora sp. NPDC001898]|uniref:hypothetical protein n=1 Tax=Micromonospora sp. NPDC001898 TaxID=3364221 RepID=UPI003698585F